MHLGGRSDDVCFCWLILRMKLLVIAVVWVCLCWWDRHQSEALRAGTAAERPHAGHSAGPSHQPGNWTDAGKPSYLWLTAVVAAADTEEDVSEGVLAGSEAWRPRHSSQAAEWNAGVSLRMRLHSEPASVQSNDDCQQCTTTSELQHVIEKVIDSFVNYDL